MIPIWVKKADGNYMLFPHELLHTFKDGKVGAIRNPYYNSQWLIFQGLCGRPLGEFFIAEMYVSTPRSPFTSERWLLRQQEGQDAGPEDNQSQEDPMAAKAGHNRT